MSARLIMKLEVAAVERVAADVSIFTFRHPKRPALPPSTAGAHVDVHLPEGRVRQYSLCGDPADASVYRIAVKREDDGRGGSRWLHETLAPGMSVPVSAPRNHFPLAAEAQHHVLIGGGIGVTPMLAMAYSLRASGAIFELHYCGRGASPPFADTLRTICGERLTIYRGAGQGERFDPGPVAANRGADVHIYCCGPSGLMDAVRVATAACPPDSVHVETFKPLRDGGFVPEPFEVECVSDGRVLQVAADESVLQVLRRNGVSLPSSCELGVCGSCECKYIAGEMIHRDVVLTPAARLTSFIACVSRGRGRIVVDC